MTTAETAGPTNRYLRRGATVVLLSMVGGFAADYGFNVTLARVLNLSEYGDFKVAYSFAFLASTVVVLGGDRAASSLLSTHIERGERTAVWEYLRFYSLVAACLSAGVVAAVFVASHAASGPLQFTGRHALVHISFVVPFIAFGALLARILQAGKHLTSATVPWRIAFPLLKVALILLLTLVVPTVALDHAVAAAALAVLLVCGWLWFRLRQLRLIVLRRQPELFDSRLALRTSLPMMFVMILALGLAQTDIFMMEWLGEEHHVGHLAAAAASAQWVFLSQTAILGAFAPLIAPAMARGERAARDLFRNAQISVVVAALAIGGVLLVFAPQLLTLFGPDFTDAAGALRLLALAYAASCCAAPSNVWLQYSGLGSTAVLIGLVALVGDIIANSFLIPAHGAQGAAAGTLIAMAIASLLAIVVRSQHPFAPNTPKA